MQETGAAVWLMPGFFLAARNRLCFKLGAMSWYYEQSGKPVGPVTDEEMQAARNAGLVAAATRVWQTGWPDWRPAGEVFASTDPNSGYTGALPPPVPQLSAYGSAAVSMCAECRAYRADLVSLGGVMVCEPCKPRVLEKLREGVVVGAGPWKDGKLLVTLKNIPLPEACVKCGAPPVKQVKKALSWHHPAIYAIIFVGVLFYLIVAICVRKTATIFVPLCADCNRRRKRNIIIAWMGFAAAVAVFVLAGTTLEGDAIVIGVVAGLLLSLFTLFWMAFTQLVVPQKIDATYAWVKRVGAPFLDKLPQWNGPH